MYSHGAQRLDDAHTRFTLWAPSCSRVAVELQGRAPQPMQAKENGWYSLDLACPPGTCYRFVINDHLRVPDPASRQQAGDVNGFSRVVDHAAYTWRQSNWQGRPWREAVIYELHVGLFGGFQQVEAHLPHLAELGVTVLQMMPIGAFPGQRNWGYDGVLPFAPASSYGTPEQLKHLIDKAHDFGLMVFLDVVYNHFGPEGNYLGSYANSFFREDRVTPWGAAIDFRQAPVREFFYENALMWLLDYRIDGLRLDAVHAIDDDEFLLELAARVRRTVPKSRHVHLVLENENNSASLLSNGFTAQWNDDGHNTLHHLLTDEQESYYADYAVTPTQKLATCLEQGFVYQGQSNRHGHPRGEPSGHLPPHAFVLFLQNHDQIGNRAFGERLVNITDTDALKAATVLLLLCPMVPLLFMGEEWGSRRPFLFFSDYRDDLANAVCDGRRNEFAEFSQFAHPQTRQRIPDPNAYSTFAKSQPDFAPALRPRQQEWLAFYKGLLHVRRTRIVPELEHASTLGTQVLGDGAVLASWRIGNSKILRIAVNFGYEAVRLGPLPPLAERLYAHRANDDEYRQGLLPSSSALVTLELMV